ncbi:MAG TPA: biotin/lipoyl-binding protein [Allocoleopsis sp.]
MVESIHSNALRSLHTDEFLPPISRWTSLGGMILVGAITLAVGLSAVIKYNVAVKAEATVRPVGELRVVQSELEGTVKQIEVKENQTVKAGDVIAYLDDSKLQMQSNQLRDTIQQNQFQLAQLDAQVRLLDSQILAESHSTDRSLAAAQAEITRNQRDYVEKQLTAVADVQEAQVAVETAQTDMQRYQTLAEVGAISQQQFQEKQAAFRMAQARLERAQATLNPSSAVVEIATEQLGQQQARGEVTVATLNREREALIQRRSEIQSQLIRDQTDLAQVEEDLKKSTIRATTAGTIFQLSLLNPNQVIRMGDNVAQTECVNDHETL